MKGTIDGARHRLGEGGFSDARYILNQQVATRQKAYQRHPDGFCLAANTQAYGIFHLLEFPRRYARAERGRER
jgi:hypothetical protein